MRRSGYAPGHGRDPTGRAALDRVPRHDRRGRALLPAHAVGHPHRSDGAAAGAGGGPARGADRAHQPPPLPPQRPLPRGLRLPGALPRGRAARIPRRRRRGLPVGRRARAWRDGPRGRGAVPGGDGAPRCRHRARVRRRADRGSATRLEPGAAAPRGRPAIRRARRGFDEPPAGQFEGPKRAPGAAYGEATGIAQTFAHAHLGASLGLAVMAGVAVRAASRLAPPPSPARPRWWPRIMVAACVVAKFLLARGRVEETEAVATAT